MGRKTGRDRVRISGHVAGHDTSELHGERGKVIRAVGGEYHDAKSGEARVSVRLDDGRIVGVPAKALERD